MPLLVKNKSNTKLPIEIINNILIYVGELNNEILIKQYCIISKKIYYKLNMFSDFLWNIKSLLVTRRLYPLYDNPLSIMKHKCLYRWAKNHYEKLLKNNTEI